MMVYTCQVFAERKSDILFKEHLERMHKGGDRMPSKAEKIRLKRYYYHPIDLNAKNIQGLLDLRIVSPIQVDNLIQYIQGYGKLATITELQAIPSWDIKTIRSIRPFVHVTSSWRKRIKNTRSVNEFTTYVIPQKNFQKNPTYFGDPSQMLLRYQCKKPQLYRCVLVASKNPNEPYCWYDPSTNMYGPFGYWGGYGLVENIGPLKKVIVGDYEIGLGEGLVIGNSFSIGKSQEVIPIMQAGYQGIKPYGTFQRKGGFRGLACEGQRKNWGCIAYVSKRKLDITIHQKKQETSYITTLATRGISYATQKDLDKKDGVEEEVIGGALLYTDPSYALTVGAQALYSRYSVPLNLGKGLDHTHFFKGKRHGNLSFFGHGLWRNYHFFGEVACGQNLSIAMITGTMAALGKKTDFACLWYHYPPQFHALYGNAFARQGAYNRNAQGFYLGTQHRRSAKLKLKAYFDLSYYFVQHKTLHHAPAYAQEVMASATYTPRRNQVYTLIVKATNQPKNLKGSKLMTPLLQQEKRVKLAFKATYPIKENHKAYTQLQGLALRGGAQKLSFGGGIKQFFHYKTKNLDLKWWITGYYTDNYASAIRFYVHSLRGGMNYPPCHGVGLEIGVLIRCRITQHLRLSLQISFNSRRRNAFKVTLQLSYTS